MSLPRSVVRVLPDDDNLHASKGCEIRPRIDVLCYCRRLASGPNMKMRRSAMLTCWVNLRFGVAIFRTSDSELMKEPLQLEEVWLPDLILQDF